MDYPELICRLDALADPSLEAYQKKIVSDTAYPMRCIRVPVLRKLARELAKDDWRDLLREAHWEIYEEVLVLGLAVAYAKVPFREKLVPLRGLLPHLDSWAMTDSIVPTLKPRKEELPAVWAFAMECLESEMEYTRRFGVVLLLDDFLTPEHMERVTACLVSITDGRYYVRMAVAWCLAEMAVSDPDRVEDILERRVLDPFVHDMTIRKMRESYRIAPERKAAAAALRRKDRNEESIGSGLR